MFSALIIIGEKIRQLGADSDLVKTVLKVFCSKEKYFRNNTYCEPKVIKKNVYTFYINYVY